MNFDNIIGNDAVKKELRKTVQNNLIGHSYIFQGTEGIGKELFAECFAKEILCENSNGCDTCKSCIMFDSYNHPDFMVINKEESALKIEEIREVIKKVIEKPIISKNKVYIINAADKMTREAQNCLLKTLEEPPEYMTMILIVSNENALLTTIKSRCTKITFNKLNNDEIKRYIREKTEIPENEINEQLISIFDGSVKKANKVLSNKELYIPIEKLLENTKAKSKLEFYLEGKVIYNKDEIYDILEYIVSVLYNLSSKDRDFLKGISIVQDTIRKLKANNNFDMSLDGMLFDTWEEVNENNSWS